MTRSTRWFRLMSLVAIAGLLLLAVPPLAQGAAGGPLDPDCTNDITDTPALPPYEGMGMAQWDETEMQATWFGTFVRVGPGEGGRFGVDRGHGLRSCTLIFPPPGGVIPGITSLEEFQAIRPADLQDSCFNRPDEVVATPLNCVLAHVGLFGGASEAKFAKIIGVRSLRFTSDTTLEADVLFVLYNIPGPF